MIDNAEKVLSQKYAYDKIVSGYKNTGGYMEYIAHRKENGNDQLLLDHLTGVANMAEYFAADFRAEDFGRCVGMLHDIGKYSNRFQRYIRGEEKLKRGDVDHSSAGAIEAYHMSANAIGLIMSYCISGHHSGLLDGGSKYDDNESAATLWGRLNKEVEDYSSYTNEIQISDKPQKPHISLITESINEKGNFSLSFFIRMVFSCLVDADFLDTEKYMTDGMQDRDAGEDIHSLKKKLDSFLNKNGYLKGKKGINKYRSDILKECIEEGKGDENFYTLTVPTGGGKTISSLAFALERAEKASKKRVIYVIPYCSIIEQTVDIFRHIFGENNVLAAYSNADYDDENLRLSADNWNKPIVVTTSVQFFESFYSNRTSACRKLHNVADSVIIFDEAQLLPEFRLKPCIRVIEELGVNYGCVAVLCTATQPSLNQFFEKVLINRKPGIILKEICADTKELFTVFRRVSFNKIGKISDDELAEKLEDHEQVLCIVSTRKQAANLFKLLDGDGIYHLSTLMTAEHRRRTLKDVRSRLQNNKRCIVVSTSLIEAGVDVDFPCVYKAETGLDSIIQAGGRCNREGGMDADRSIVYVFEPEDKYKTPRMLKRPLEVEQMVTNGEDDISSTDIIRKYFDTLHTIEDSGQKSGLDADDIVGSFENAEKLSYPFDTIGRKFRMIDSDTYSVFIPDERSDNIVWKLENDIMLTPDEYRHIGRCSVNIYENELNKIRNYVDQIDDRSFILMDSDLYDERMGLICDDDRSGEAIFF